MQTWLRSVFLTLAVASWGQTTFAQAPRADEIRQLRGAIEKALNAELTGRWYPNAIDRQGGGFHQSFGRNWTPRPDENRSLVYQSRMTWTAAAFAEFSPKARDEYLAYVRHGVGYLDQVMRDREAGGFHWVLDPKGRIDPEAGTEKHVYGTAFVLYAASKSYSVTHDELALKVARDAFDWLEAHSHDARQGGYIEALTREGKPILGWEEGAPLTKRSDRLGVYYGYKSMNSHIHLLEAMAEFYRVEKSMVVRKRLEELLSIVRDKIAVPPGALNLYFTADWRPTPAHDSFGHDIETAFLIVEAADALGIPDDESTWKVARQLVDHALDFGWDDRNGGFFDKGDVFAGRAYDTTKIWWTQAEGLNALLLMHRKYGSKSDRYWDAFRKQWAFIASHVIDPTYGGWFAEVTSDGKLLGDGRKGDQWKANYHTGRAMMNAVRLLGELLEG